MDENGNYTELDYRKTLKKSIIDSLETNLDLIVVGNFFTINSRLEVLFEAFNYNRNLYTSIINLGIGNDLTLQKRINERPDVKAEKWNNLHYEYQDKYEAPSCKELSVCDVINISAF